MVKLASALADSPSTIFQTLAVTIQEITHCDSAGLSLLTRDGKKPHVDGERFYWPAICGMWNPHVGGGTPRNFGPCGDVLDQNRTLLFRHFERRYPYLIPVSPAAEECLLVPFYVDGQAVGTIWGIMHYRAPQIRRRGRANHGLTWEICFLRVSSTCAHRGSQNPGGGAGESGSRSPSTGERVGNQDPAPRRSQRCRDRHVYSRRCDHRSQRRISPNAAIHSGGSRGR